MRPFAVMGLATGIFAAVCWAPKLVHADRVVLTDGAVIEGKAVREGQKVVIRLEMGTLRVPAASVVRIEKAETPLERIAKARAALPAEAVTERLRLADVCREQGLQCEQELLREVLAIDPDQPVARARLGYEREGQAWVARDSKRAVDAQAEHDAQVAKLDRERAELERDTARLAQKRAELELESARRAQSAQAPAPPTVVVGAGWYGGAFYPWHRPHVPGPSQRGPSFSINGVRSPSDMGFHIPGVRSPQSYFP